MTWRSFWNVMKARTHDLETRARDLETRARDLETRARDLWVATGLWEELRIAQFFP